MLWYKGKERICIYCSHCKRSVYAQVNWVHAVKRTENQADLDQSMWVCCHECGTRLDAAKFLRKAAERMEIEMYIGQVMYKKAWAELHDCISEKVDSELEARTLATECMNWIDWDKETRSVEEVAASFLESRGT